MIGQFFEWRQMSWYQTASIHQIKTLWIPCGDIWDSWLYNHIALQRLRALKYPLNSKVTQICLSQNSNFLVFSKTTYTKQTKGTNLRKLLLFTVHNSFWFLHSIIMLEREEQWYWLQKSVEINHTDAISPIFAHIVLYNCINFIFTSICVNLSSLFWSWLRHLMLSQILKFNVFLAYSFTFRRNQSGR